MMQYNVVRSNYMLRTIFLEVYMNKYVTLGLYQHFKGEYVYVDNIAVEEKSGTPIVHYFNVLRPELGFFTRPTYEWYSDVSNRKDNMTGQTTRFKKVVSLVNPAKNLTTEQLLAELRTRNDSPFQSLDFDGLNDKCVYHDFVVGILYGIEEPMGIETIASFNNIEEAKDYNDSHPIKREHHIYKRTFVEFG